MRLRATRGEEEGRRGAEVGPSRRLSHRAAGGAGAAPRRRARGAPRTRARAGGVSLTLLPCRPAVAARGALCAPVGCMLGRAARWAAWGAVGFTLGVWATQKAAGAVPDVGSAAAAAYGAVTGDGKSGRGKNE